MKMIRVSLSPCGLAGIILALSACSGSININHPVIKNITPESPTANVYFLRPSLLKPKGIADNILHITANDIQLLEIRAGTYTLIKMLPGKVRIATHSLTKFTNKPQPIPVSRFRDYNFVAGKTYFIHLFRVNEEFRGVFFDPRPVDLRTAKSLLDSISPFDAAKDAPLESLKHVEETPEASELTPVVPEKLYPEEKYLLTPHPFK